MSNTQLPAHLLALFQSTPEITEVGKNVQNESHAKIRYNGSKWKLISATGEEIAVPSDYLDVIVVDINEHKSHVVYEKAFDPKGDAEAPIWSSDDGTPVPAEHENKVVSDYRRVAVLIADNPEGGIYELRVSAGSITNFDKYNTAIRNFGVPIGSLVTHITFDKAFDYPKLVFSPSAYLTAEQAEALKKAFGANKNHVQMVIGKRKENALLEASTTQGLLPPPVGGSIQRADTQPLQSMDAASEVKPAKRTRKTEAAAVGGQRAALDVAQEVVPSFLKQPPATVVKMAHPTPTPAAQVVTKPQATSEDLNALLQNIMKR